jgi:enamine deaminase RidA (YjgF/YER057c/UK114 family)
MKRRRFFAAGVGTLVLGGLFLMSGGPGVAPTWAQNPTPQQQQLRQILDKLDQVLAATKAASAEAESAKSAGNEDIQTMQWDKAMPASQRFVVLAAFNNDAVLDKETGLVWEKSPQSAAVSLPNARLACANKAVGGRKGWRLPALPELASLVDPSVASPARPFRQGIHLRVSSRPTIGQHRLTWTIRPLCGAWASATAPRSVSARLSTSASGVFVVG